MAKAIGLTTARQIWCALEDVYSHDSVECMHTLRDSLRQIQKGSSTIADFSLKFKTLCDQLSAIGHPVADTDKFHWFICGLGPFYETFSTARHVIHPRPVFRDLVAHVESHKLFLQFIHVSATPQATFISH